MINNDMNQSLCLWSGCVLCAVCCPLHTGSGVVRVSGPRTRERERERQKLS